MNVNNCTGGEAERHLFQRCRKASLKCTRSHCTESKTRSKTKSKKPQKPQTNTPHLRRIRWVPMGGLNPSPGASGPQQLDQPRGLHSHYSRLSAVSPDEPFQECLTRAVSSRASLKPSRGHTNNTSLMLRFVVLIVIDYNAV